MFSDAEIHKLAEALTVANAAIMGRLNATLQAQIPIFQEEYGVSDLVEISGSGTLTLTPSRDTYFKVTGFFAQVPLNVTSATLQLGNGFSLPLQNTTTMLSPIQKVLTSTDVRKLSFTCGAANGGQATLWLFGEALPSYGKL